MSNYKELFSLGTLKHIGSIFTESFLVLYFLSLSNNNILPLGIYYLIVYATIYFTIYFFKIFF